MAVIEIPDGYWTITPRGFTGAIAPFSDALRSVAGDVGGAFDALDRDADPALRQQLGDVDGDAADILAAAATEHDAVTTTPTGDVVAGYAVGDRLTVFADTQVGAAGGIVQTDPVIPPPPPMPGDGEFPPPPPIDTPTGPGFQEATAAAPARVMPAALPTPPADAGTASGDSGEGGAVSTPETSTIPPTPSAPGNAGEQPESAAAPPPPRYVTHDELAAVLDSISPTITLMV